MHVQYFPDVPVSFSTEESVARALDTWLARSRVFQLGVLEFSGLLATPVERTVCC